MYRTKMIDLILSHVKNYYLYSGQMYYRIDLIAKTDEELKEILTQFKGEI